MSEWQTKNIHLQVGGIPNSILFMKIFKQISGLNRMLY